MHEVVRGLGGKDLTPRSDRTRRNGVATEALTLDDTKGTPTQEVEAPLQEGNVRKPEVSPKRVTAPWHFFLENPMYQSHQVLRRPYIVII